MTIKDLTSKIDVDTLMKRSLVVWRDVLCQECQVYVFGENYLAKRFDQINYKFCGKDEAKEILIDNLYALLRYKYFTISTEEIDDKINEIVKSFTANLKTTLIKKSFDKLSSYSVMTPIPDYCCAFRNGVYDFKNNEWLFKYEIVNLPKLNNSIYLYDTKWCIFWYLDYDFEDFGIDITSTPLSEFVQTMKEITKEQQNYCFELAYNISHDATNKFTISRFRHLCEVLGYSILQSFSQYFVLMIGSGQNGKNSLFDGCFTNRVIPRPAANDMDSIENDRFITGSLENRCHNIFLETSAKTYTESKMIKALTGSMYQTIESKGISKYSGIINCKYIFAGNDQEKIKFSDTTVGFRRRINVFEIWYRWDQAKKFLKDGDYYDTTFSDTLSELKDDPTNTSVYVYLAMYGIMSGTNNFTKNFQFSTNDWKEQYTDINRDLKEIVESVTPETIVRYLKSTQSDYEEGKSLLFDMQRQKLYKSDLLLELGYHDYDGMISLLSTPEQVSSFFTDNDVFISVRQLQKVVKYPGGSSEFSSELKKIYNITQFEYLYGNKPYVKVTFRNNKMVVRGGRR